MDPNELLMQLVEEARGVIARNSPEESLELAQHVLDMHEWLSKGGFLPAAWDVSRSAGDPGRSGL